MATTRSPDEDAPRGTVYGVLLNYRGALSALGDAVHAPPYKAPPRAPVLYVKPANTWTDAGAAITVPRGIDALAMGAALALVIGRTAARVPRGEALACVRGYAVVNDVCVPHASFHRPAIRAQCRDGFCAIGPVLPAAHVGPPDVLGVRVRINDALVQQSSTADLLRPAAELLEDVTAFMTLAAGDLLLVGVPPNPPLARRGDRVRIEIDGLPALENTLVDEAA
jgi:5-oxopent-3-ene-1,2,5-tricarboxylate decarboxylase/2-hydroxyhepta-2,4-diene-1,7-dioate isomerase